MRPLEIALVVGLLPGVVLLLSPSRTDRPLLVLFSIVAAAIAGCQLIAEGPRWQMWAAYLLVLALLIHTWSNYPLPASWSFFSGVAGLALAAIAILLSTVWPVFSLPSPTGPQRVGTQTRHLVDESRLDQSSGPRELMIQLWYPVDTSVRGQTARYREKSSTSLRNVRFSMVKTHAVLDAPLARSPQRFPVLLYLPSWTGSRSENTLQLEELASHGYVVAAIDHPYGSLLTVFPDGRQIGTTLTGLDAFSSHAALARFIGIAEQQAKIRSADALFVLDTLEHLDRADPAGLLEGRLDLTRVGIFGFSFGGGVAVYASSLDGRFKAVLDLDGMVMTQLFKRPPSASLFFILEDLPQASSSADERTRLESEFDREQIVGMRRMLAEGGGYLMTVDGTLHSNFSDAPFYSPLRLNAEVGRADPVTTARTISRYMLAFFDRHLKGEDRQLLASTAKHTPDIHLEVWNSQGATEQTH